VISLKPRRAGPAAGALLACLALLGGVAIAGCGGDDEETAPTTTPTIEPATPTGPTGAAGEQGDEQKPASDDSDVDPEDGTVTPPPESDSQSSGGTAPVDSAENDIPPEEGSPEAEFEKYCDENPDACG
jgi:hypothetical protein